MSCHHGVPTVNGSSWPSTVPSSSQATRVTTRSIGAIMPGAVRSCCCLSSELMKQTLHQYLQTAHDAVVWKLDGLAEYDVRRPLVPTGTNLLGLVKHLTCRRVWLLRPGLRPADGGAETPGWMMSGGRSAGPLRPS